MTTMSPRTDVLDRGLHGKRPYEVGSDENLEPDKDSASKDLAAPAVCGLRSGAAEQIASDADDREREREDQDANGDPLERPRDVLHRVHAIQPAASIGRRETGTPDCAAS